MFSSLYNFFKRVFQSDNNIENNRRWVILSHGQVKIQSFYCNLYIFCKHDIYGGVTRTNFWKNKGTGNITFVKHLDTNIISLAMWQHKTNKLILNTTPDLDQILIPQGENSFCFKGVDLDGENRVFSVRFTDLKLDILTTTFKDFFNYAVYNNGNNRKKGKNKRKITESLIDVEYEINKKIYSSVMNQLLQYNIYDKNKQFIKFQVDAILSSIK